ncbi:hypothetical protein [Mucilaginibacter sp.]|uniref:FEKKY domain-containing protein n=1 Tax=Mucilaginibacter sp. TaxID=1882438 RepID=UPI0035BC934E
MQKRKALSQVAYSTCFIFLILTCCVSCTQHNGRADVKVATPGAVVDISLKWVDYHFGEPPPEGYYAAFDSVIKKWNIRYQRIEGGCEALPAERNKYEKDNPKYFKIIESEYGKDWLNRFYADVKMLEQQSYKK